ncbi:hypothetical protein CR513_34359, partial [Mucuna pruriens]
MEGVVVKLIKEVSLTPTRYIDLFLVEPCTVKERVFMRAREGNPTTSIWVTLPFDTFKVDVSNMLNIVPSQLHLNGWAVMQAFRVTCQKSRWVSMIEVSKTCLFNTYSTSYKDFKGGFCKIRVKDESPLEMFSSTDQLGFPLKSLEGLVALAKPEVPTFPALALATSTPKMTAP